MARRIRVSGVPNPSDAIRQADVIVFLEAFKAIDDPATSPEKLVNLNSLLKHLEDQLGPSTTVIGQLRRIARFLSVEGEDDLDVLFSKKGGIIRPTEVARRARSHFLNLRDAYEALRQDALVPTPSSPPVVRLGTPQTIGFRIISSVFSGWHKSDRLRDFARLEVRIANSLDLIPRLNVGLFDLVVAFRGSPTSAEEYRLPSGITFRPLDYESRMVLLAHPSLPLLGRVYEAEKLSLHAACLNQCSEEAGDLDGRNPPYKELPEIRLEQLEFGRMKPLIVVPSWQQPAALTRFVSQLPDECVVEVPWYEEALALTRMGLGVAVTTEIFSTRRRVKAFKLAPEAEFTRSLGIYYNVRTRITPTAYMISQFIRKYIEQFETHIRAGEPPALGNQKYEDFCRNFDLGRDWHAEAKSPSE